MKDIAKLGIFLMIVAGIAAAALSTTYILCAPKIEEQKVREREAALTQVLPAATSFKEAQKTVDGIEVSYFQGFSNEKTVGAAIMVSPMGYGGSIEMLVGIDSKGKVSGVKILKSAETPGLGLNADDPRFLLQFKGKSSDDKLKAKLDIQAITGATITTQTIADGVREALRIFKKLEAE